MYILTLGRKYVVYKQWNDWITPTNSTDKYLIDLHQLSLEGPNWSVYQANYLQEGHLLH